MGALKILKKILVDFGRLILFYLSYLYPRKKNIWVFGSWFGHTYSDNSKYLFEYIDKNTTIKAIWISKNKDIITKLKSHGFLAYHYGSLASFYYISIAKVGVVSCAPHDIASYSIAGMKIINLWHGTPLKKIMFDVEGYKKLGLLNQINRLFFPFKFISFSMITASSEETKSIYASAFQISSNKIKITGYPRNDAFYIQNQENPFIKKIDVWKAKGYYTGIYLPTHRDTEKNKFYNSLIENLKILDKELDNKKIRTIIKLHFYLNDLVQKSKIHFNNLVLIDESDIDSDLYAILPHMDYLITDYSSVYFDYLLADKPIIFFPFDIEEYLTKDRELYYDFEEVTPGYKVYNSFDLAKKLTEISIGIDEYSGQRAEINNKFNTYTSTSSKRVYIEICKLIGYNEN